MFRFLEISLHGWDYWRNVRIPLEKDVVLLIGPNGSGKTTMLDAIRQLLNTRRLSSRRRVQHYIRHPNSAILIRAVVTNVPINGRGQPFKREGILDSETTLACTLVPQGSGAPEKRYVIAPGRLSVEKIKHIIYDTKDWYAPERYSRALENAGLSKSLINVLAIEQGSIDELATLKPRDLFVKVLNMMGNHVIIERYQKAQEHLEDARKEEGRLTGDLLAKQSELNMKRAEADRLEQYESLQQEIEDLDERYKAAHLQEYYKARSKLYQVLEDRRSHYAVLDADRLHLESQVEEITNAKKEADTKMKDAKRTYDEIRKEHIESVRKNTVADEVLKVLENKRSQLNKFPKVPNKIVKSRLDQAAEEVAIIKHKRQDANAEMERLNKDLKRLESGLPVYPLAVQNTLDDLTLQHISTKVVASFIDVKDSNLLVAVENAIGDARFGLIVKPSQVQKVLNIATKHNYPGPIYTGPVSKAGTHGILKVVKDAPEWLRDSLIDVELRKDGSWKDHRGIWIHNSHFRVLGQAAIQDSLEQVKEKLTQSVTRHKKINVQLKQAERILEDLGQQFYLCQRREEYKKDIAGIDEARKTLKVATENFNACKKAEEKAEKDTEAMQRIFNKAQTRYEKNTERISDVRKRLKRDCEEIADNEQKLQATKNQIEQLEPEIGLELIPLVQNGELDGKDTYKIALKRRERELKNFGTPPKASIKKEVELLQINVNQLHEYLKERRQMQEEAEKEVQECRQDYLQNVEETQRRYKSRVKELAHLANVSVVVQLPILKDVSDGMLQEAGIEVRFGFDEKAPLLLGDASFSGGQKVINGLILLMAMGDLEGQGFFILDEPFAHLSIDRIDQVGSFLQNTKSQFIITAPTTLDRAQLDPASQLITLFKKRKGTSFAPDPVIAVA